MKYSRDNHEDIIDSVRVAWNCWNLEHETEPGDRFFIVEHFAAKCVQPELITESLRADSYIGLGDDFPLIFLEVGQMPDGKWAHLRYAVDNKPARVLRVGFDRHAFLLHPRHTQQEQHWLSFLNSFLENEDALLEVA